MNKLFLFVFFLIPVSCFSQLTILDLAKFTIGQDKLSARNKIKNYFQTAARFSKRDIIYNVSDYEFENSNFNFCNNASYDFMYLDSILSHVKISMTYSYDKEKDEHEQYLKAIYQLFRDIKQSNDLFKILPEYSNLNLDQVEKKVDSLNFFSNSKKKDEYFSERYYYGENTYLIKNNKSDPQLIRLNTAILKYYKPDSSFDKIVMFLTVELTSIKYQDVTYDERYLSSTRTLLNEKKDIDLTFQNGVYVLPVTLNGVLKLNFILDLGASDVSISPDVFLVLYKAGTINDSDFIGTEQYQFADGSKAKSDVFLLKSITIGEITITNIKASISNNINTPLLLGQSALKQLPSYKIDNSNHKLIIE